MCRMLLGVGDIDMEFLVDGLTRMADGHNTHYCWHDAGITVTHHHSWGAALHDGKTWHVRRVPRKLNAEFSALRTLSSRIALLHARRATVGEVRYDNVHPFEEQDAVFCHNGTVLGEIPCSGGLAQKGTTDSERLFHAFLHALEKKAPQDAYENVLSQLEGAWATNSFLATSSRILVLCSHTDKPRSYLFQEGDVTREITIEPHYYTLRIARTPTQVIVSSETLPGLDWEDVPNDTLIQIDPKTLDVTLIPLTIGKDSKTLLASCLLCSQE